MHSMEAIHQARPSCLISQSAVRRALDGVSLQFLDADFFTTFAAFLEIVSILVTELARHVCS